MKYIQSKFTQRTDTEFFVINLEEPTKISFGYQSTDVIVSSPDIDILVGWDYENETDFTPENSMLIKVHDNLKELAKEMCTHFYLMPYKTGEKGKVFVTIQR